MSWSTESWPPGGERPPTSATRRGVGYDRTIDEIPRQPGRRERNKADKWERILRAAAKLFNERGFAGTTTTAVARAAGIGTGTLFLYVPSKEHLLVAVFRDEVGRAWDRAFESVDVTQPLFDQLCDAFVGVIEYHEHDPGLARAFIRELPTVSEPAREGARDFIRDFMRRLEAFLVGAQDRGQLQRDVCTTTLATSLYALYQFHIHRRVSGHSDVVSCRADLASAFDLQLRGLVPQGQ